MKQVIFKNRNQKYCITCEDNYYSRKRRHSEIRILEDFNSAEEIVKYFCNNFLYTKEEFIVIDK